MPLEDLSESLEGKAGMDGVKEIQDCYFASSDQDAPFQN